ncbi:MAG: energy transducer TonB [Marinifilaceae bacterium]
MEPLKQVFSGLLNWVYQTLPSFWEDVKDFLYRNRYGVMGTIAFHMILLILLLLLKLNTRRQFLESEIFIEIPEELIEELEKLEEKEEPEEQKGLASPSESVEELLKSIAVNQDVREKSTSDPAESVEKMIEEIRKDLSGAEELQAGTSDDADFVADSLKFMEEREKQKLLDSLQSIVYSGPSSVYYKLEGRHQVYLPIPIYKCEGEGLIVVEITVNRSGRVVGKRIQKEKSSVDDPCLFEAALSASGNSRFNASPESPVHQKGTISYNFVKQ